MRLVGADMYEITITGTSFSAITSLRQTSTLNPALYLFNSSGVALYAENDISGTNDQAQINVASGPHAWRVLHRDRAGQSAA